MEIPNDNIGDFRQIIDDFKSRYFPFEGIVVHSNNIIFEISRQLCEMVGYTREELIDSDALEIIAEDYHSIVRYHGNKEKSEPYAMMIVTKDGNRIALEAQGEMITYQDVQYRLVALRRMPLLNVNESAIIKALELSPNYVLTVDKHGMIKYTNKINITKDGNRELETSVTRFLSNDSKIIMNEAIDVAFSEGKESKIQVRTSGNLTFVTHVTPIFVDNHVSEVLITGIDISELIEIKVELQQERHYHEELLKQLPDAIILTDMEGTVQEWYGRSEEIFGYTSEEAFGNHVNFVFQEKVRRKSTEWIATEILSTGKFNGDIPSITKDGKELVINSSISTVFDQENEPVALIGIVKDVTQNRKEEEEKRKIRQMMFEAQKEESLSVLAGGIAHDFNNLLVGILGNASLLLAQMDTNNPDREIVENIQNVSTQASELVKKLMSFTGASTSIPVICNVNKVLAEVITLVRVSVNQKIDINVKSDEDVFIKIDESQMHQMFLNLIINASDAIGVASGTINIELSNHSIADMVLIKISDSGIGIHPDNVNQIFDPFYTSKAHGKGLGLTVVKNIIRTHLGTIHVESEVGQGTTFWISFPRVDGSSQVTEKITKSHHSAFGGHALICDDEDVVRDLANKMLDQLGFQTTTVKDGNSCLKQLKKLKFQIDLILLDITLPDISGIDILKNIMSNGYEGKVLLSSGFSNEKFQEYIEVNQVGFLQKPYTFSDLKSKLCELLD